MTACLSHMTVDFSGTIIAATCPKIKGRRPSLPCCIQWSGRGGALRAT